MKEEKERLGIEILQQCRNRLYEAFPYLDGAFASLGYQALTGENGIQTDGEQILFAADWLIAKYRENPSLVTRGYLHLLLHCLYLHIFPEPKADAALWDLACDLAVELTIERENKKETGRITDAGREQCVRRLMAVPCSAQQLYRMLEAGEIPEDPALLRKWFSFDEHRGWYADAQSLSRSQTRKKWEQVLAYTGQHREQNKRRGARKGDQEEILALKDAGKYDYKRFLKRFAFPREEVELDLESFDYIFYHLGMEQYGDMPLIEPLEYREVNRLEELVIAIDTSGSCSAEVVQQFLAETYRILSDRENFFRKMKVYLIQCDCCIQEVAVIHSEEEWQAYSTQIRIQGRGGTDFRPVFAYVEKLRQTKELKALKALIYFTDGDGIYPRERPEYESAFVLMEKTAKPHLVPDWARKLVV